MRPGIARGCAALVSLVAFAGLGVQFAATLATEQSLFATLWILVRFFTVLTNILVAVLFGALAMGRTDIATPSRVGAATLAILLVGIVYALLLNGLLVLSGGAFLADMLLHKVTPIIAPLCWLVAAPKGYLTPRDPWLWALYPLVYFAYALLRGVVEGKFAYPFLNFLVHGWPYVIAHAVIMAAGFLAMGQALVWLDGRMVRRR